MQNTNFKTVNTWDELSKLDKAFLEEWLIFRHVSSADVTEQHYAQALEHYNENGVALEAHKSYEIGFDGGDVESWWEWDGTDAELLEMINEADADFGGGTFECIDDLLYLGEYIQTSDYMGVLFT